MIRTEDYALLEWYAEAGIDSVMEDAPRNYFIVPELPKAPAIPAPVLFEMPVTAPSSTRTLADNANTLAALKEAVMNFEGCALKKTARNTVFSDGNPESRIMVIGEAPGQDEDIQGIPFCGVSGKLLDKMFAAIGLTRNDYYITNTLFWRPPANRTPSPEEVELCKPFLEKHIHLVNPKLIIMVGGVAAKAMLNVQEGITRLRGKNYHYTTPYSDKSYESTILYHPSYLLRQPSHKRVTWQDLLRIKGMISDKPL